MELYVLKIILILGILLNYKLATRYKIAPNFNLRGAIATGFRAILTPNLF
jgi:hypothetical protein